MWKKYLVPPRAADNEIEQFWRMEIVDMALTKNWFSGQKSRSVNIFVQQPDLGLRWDFTPWVSRPDKTNESTPPGQIS